MLPNSQVVEMFKFSSHRLTEAKFHLLSNAHERAHKSVRLISGNGTGTSDDDWKARGIAWILF